MNTKRFNLRMVATIVACLAATTMFASCGKNGGDDDGGGTTSGKIDQQLVGEWEIVSTNLTSIIEFKSNGKYNSVVVRRESNAYSVTYYGTLMRGNYSTKDGVYTLTKLETISGSRKDRAINWMDEELSWNWTNNWHSLATPTQKFYYEIGTE